MSSEFPGYGGGGGRSIMQKDIYRKGSCSQKV